MSREAAEFGLDGRLFSDWLQFGWLLRSADTVECALHNGSETLVAERAAPNRCA